MLRQQQENIKNKIDNDLIFQFIKVGCYFLNGKVKKDFEFFRFVLLSSMISKNYAIKVKLDKMIFIFFDKGRD
jgi:hypothetical protein